jgi:hypothetical protein
MKLTDKIKKRLTLAGLGVVCVVLVIAISSQFKTEKPVDVPIQPSPTMSVEVNPSEEPPTSTVDPTTTPEVSVLPIDPTATPDVTASTDTADSSGTDQSLQAKPTKPAAPTEKPTPKPETSAKDTSKAPEYKPEDTVKTEPSSPKAGDINDKGQMWVPGFGWVDDSGPNQGTVVDGEGDIDKQVGNMD